MDSNAENARAKENAIIMAASDLALLNRSKVSLWSPDIPRSLLESHCPPIPPIYVMSDAKMFARYDANNNAIGIASGVHNGSTLLLADHGDAAHTQEIARDFNFAFIHCLIDPPGMVLDWVFSPPKSWRRYAPKPMPHIVMAAQAELHTDEIVFHLEFAHYANGRWFRSGYRGSNVQPTRTMQCGNVSLAYAVSLESRYKASLCLREIGHPGLYARICAPLPEIRALLKNRNIGNLLRRPALLHNVSTHQRETKRARVKVQEHLRGAFRCQWLGFDAVLLPSAYDVERLTESVVAQECIATIKSAGPHVTMAGTNP